MVIAKSAGVFFVIGAVLGFIWGLFVHAPTAWFAAFEIGIPAAIVGAVVGALGYAVRR